MVKKAKTTTPSVTVINHPRLSTYPKHTCHACDQLLMWKPIFKEWYCWGCRCPMTPSKLR